MVLTTIHAEYIVENSLETLHDFDGHHQFKCCGASGSICSTISDLVNYFQVVRKRTKSRSCLENQKNKIAI